MSVPTWLGSIRQTAFVVSDIEAVSMQWVSTHGVGPWFHYDVDIAGTTYRGSEVPMSGRMGLAQSGSQQIELIEPNLDNPSLYKEFLDAQGAGVHHVCYWGDVDQCIDHFVACGAELVQDGTTPAGNRFGYVSGSCGVPYVEFVDPEGDMASFFAHIAASAVDWDGSDPIRG